MNFLSDLGSFLGSIPDAISSIFSFIDGCITECSALLDVIPPGVGALMTAGIMFSIVLAVKRLVID